MTAKSLATFENLRAIFARKLESVLVDHGGGKLRLDRGFRDRRELLFFEFKER